MNPFSHSIRKVFGKVFGTGKGRKRKDRGRPPLWRLEELEARDVPSGPDGLTIPSGHPRLWLTPARLAAAKTWFAAHPFTPSATDPWNSALAYQLTGNTTYAQNAITQLMNFNISASELAGVASDSYRTADWVPVVYDWCYDQMTATQRSTFTARFNSYTNAVIQMSWGGPDMPSNNYFWGYLRSELEWGIASYGDNPNATTYIDDALVTRWQNNFVPWAAGPGAGGVAQEGTEYGRALLQYSDIPMVTAALDGRNLYAETNYFLEAACYTIYWTYPGPVAAPGSGT